jgi:hypothetical protein
VGKIDFFDCSLLHNFENCQVIVQCYNSYLRYKCKKLSFIARTGLKYD